MRSSNKLLHAMSSSMGARLATALFNYGLFWALSRLVDAKTLGAFSLLMNVFQLALLLPLLGMAVPLIRRIATSEQDMGNEVTNAVAFTAPVSVILALSVGGWGHFSHEGELALPSWLVAASLLPTAWTTVAEATLIGRERVADVARFTFVEALLRTGLALVCVWLGYGLVGIFASLLAARIVAAVLFAFHPEISLQRPSQWHRLSFLRNCREVPMYFSITLVSALTTRLDVIALSHLAGLRDVAIYAAASRLYDAAQILPTVLALVILPALARQFVSAPQQFRDTLERSVRLSLIIGLGLALIASALSGPLIALLYKPDVADAAQALRFFAFSAVLAMIDVVLSSTMLAASAQRHDLRSLLFGLLVLIASLWILAPRFGPTGTAAAVAIAMCARVGARLSWAVRHLGLPAAWHDLLRLAIACAIGIGTLIFSLRWGALAALFAAPIAYAAAVVLTGLLGRHPIRELRRDIALLTNGAAI